MMFKSNYQKYSLVFVIMGILSVSLVSAPLLVLIQSVRADWKPGWKYRKSITIDHALVGAGGLENFPVLINVTDSDLASDAQPDGDDIVFTDSEDVKLSHEIEFYEAGHLVAWVKVPILSSSEDTVLYMYYGNEAAENQEDASGVWDEHYMMVQHLNEVSGTHLDSTDNDNDGSPQGGVVQNATGKIDGADMFDGSNDYVTVPHSSTLTGFTEALTVEVWIKLDDTVSRQVILNKYDTSGSQRGWFLNYEGTTNGLGFFASETGTSYVYYYANGFTPTVGTWYHIVVVWQSGQPAVFYVNGAQITTSTSTGTVASIYNNPSAPLDIGRSTYASRYFDGVIDEVRISNPARSAEWISTSYNNQIDPSSFYTIGLEESSGAPIVFNPSPDDGATFVSISLSELSFDLVDPDEDLMNFSVSTNPFIGGGSVTDQEGGTFSVPVSGLNYNTTYTWHVNVTDGVSWTNMTYTFTTELEPQPPQVLYPNPPDGESNVPVSLEELNFVILDPNEDLMDVYVTTNPDIGSGTGEGIPDTPFSVPVSGLIPDQTYIWHVNVTDSDFWTNVTYSFTTRSEIGPYGKLITINHDLVDANLEDFPVLIDITDDDLASDAQPDGTDIYFTDREGVQLSHEIEFYEAGHLVAWVKVPSLSSTVNTTLYMYYGDPGAGDPQNPEDVWDEHYMMVQHLNEPSGTHYDSTGNWNDGTPEGGVVQDAAGKIDGADIFDGTDDYVEVPHSSTLAGFTEALTVEVWIKMDDTASRQSIVHKYDTSDNQRGWFVEYYSNLIRFFASATGSSYDYWQATFNPVMGTWYYISVVWEANQIPKFYINGQLVSTSRTGTISSIYNNVGAPLDIGRSTYSADRYFDGVIDEVRISNPARSAEWISTCFNNQMDPSAFMDIGPPPGTPVVSDPSPFDGETDVSISLSELSFDLLDPDGDPMDYYVSTYPDIGGDSAFGVGNGMRTVTITGLVYNTTYTWYVNVTDSVHWTNKTYSFTTEPEPPPPQPPEVSDPNPPNGATNVPVSLNELSFALADPNEDPMDYYVSTYPDIGGDSAFGVGNGMRTVTITGPLSYSTTYKWWVNVTDGADWTNVTYSFTTRLEDWWDPDWQYRKAITIDHALVDANLGNFPVLIDITDDDLASDAQPNGDDITFTDSEAAQLSHEIELYNDGHLVAWVKVPSLSASEDTVLYMYYGNPAASNQEDPSGVWDEHFKMVQHLNEPSGTHYDSTSNDNDGTPQNGVTHDETGKIDGADIFDGTDDYVTIPHSSTLTGFSEALTVEVWVKFDTTSGRQAILNKYVTTGSQRAWFLEYYTTNGLGFFVSQTGTSYVYYYASGFTPTVGTWYHIVVVWQSGQPALFYVNGAQISTTTSTGTVASIYNNPSAPLDIGRSTYSTDRYFDGVIDEVRISNPARSAEWISTCYNNQMEPSSFYDVGEEESYTLPGAPVVSDPSPFDGETDVSISLSELSFDLLDPDGDPMDYYVSTYPDIGSDTGLGVGNGPYSVMASGLVYEMTYTWHVNVTDGVSWTNKTYTFTTEPAPQPPEVSNPSPEDGATVPTSLSELSFDLLDPDGDPMDYYVSTYPDIGSDTGLGVGNGRYSVTVSGLIADETYVWYVNVTDGVFWTNVTYSLTAVLNSPPSIDSFTPGDTTPEVDEGSSLEFTHTSSDPDGDPLTYSWLLSYGTWPAVEVADTQNWTYLAAFGDADLHPWRNVTLVVSDGIFSVSQEWNVTISDMPDPEIERKWTHTVSNLGTGASSPVIADLTDDPGEEVIYVGGDIGSSTGAVLCLSGVDGHEIWRYTDRTIGWHVQAQMEDINNDDEFEIVVPLYYPTGVLVLHADGSLYWKRTGMGGSTYTSSPVVVDPDGDGYYMIFAAPEDVAGYSYVNNSYSAKLWAFNYDGREINDGLWGTAEGTRTTISGRNQWFAWRPCSGGFSMADTDNDGVFELYQNDRNMYMGDGSFAKGTIAWEWSTEEQKLTRKWYQPDILVSSHAPIIVDVNKDGILDIVAAHQRGGLAVFNSTSGSEIRKDNNLGLPGHYQPTIYDIDHDGNPEILLADGDHGNTPQDIVVWDLYEWKEDARMYVGACKFPPTIADVTGDGIMDMIAVTDTGVFVFDGSHNPAVDHTYPVITVETGLIFQCMYAVVQDIDNDGDNEFVITSSGWRVYAYDTPAPRADPRPRSEVQFYNERRTGVAEYVKPVFSDRTAPIVSDSYPSKEATDVPIDLPVLSFNITDLQGDLMNYTVTATFPIDSADIEGINVPNGTITVDVTDDLEYHTRYTWSVRVTDGVHWNNKSYTFTTPAGIPPGSSPTHDTPLLESTGTDAYVNATSMDLICTNQTTGDLDGDKVTNIYCWLKNGEPIANLLMPFDTDSLTTAKDYSGYDNDGEIHGATWTSDGKVGGAYYFDGIDDYILIPDGGVGYYNGRIYPSSLGGEGDWSEMTVEMWIYLTESSTKESTRILMKIPSYEIGLGAIGGQEPRTTSPGTTLSAAVWTDNPDSGDGSENDPKAREYLSVTYDTPLNLSTWYHVAFTYKDGKGIVLYVNGTAVASSTGAGGYGGYGGGVVKGPIKASSGEPLYIGWFDYFEGMIDDVRIYSRCLSEEQLSHHCDESKDGLSSSSTLSWTETRVDQTWTCEVTPNDAHQDGTTKLSNPVDILPGPQVPPVASNAEIIGEWSGGDAPWANETLVATYDYFDGNDDPEGSSEIIWYRNGEHVSDLDNYLTVPSSFTSAHEEWNFTVRPFDGTDFGELINSTTVIVNSPPIILTVDPEPDWSHPVELLLGESETFTITYIEPDGEDVLIQWLLKTSWMDPGTVVAVNVTSFTFTATESGSFMLQVVLTDAEPGSKSTSSQWSIEVPEP